MRKIRILGVAPYAGMRSLMTKVAATSYPQIELDVVVGDLQKGVEMAQNNFHADYDVIISRGGTAQMLREKVSLPVIDIPISEYDILRALHLAENFSSKHAIVGFSNITDNADVLADLLSIPLHAFTIHDSSEVRDILNRVSKKGYQAILCDMVATTTAKEMGLNAILITSGAESISSAFDDALTLCSNLRKLQAENHFLREVIGAQSTETVVFDQNKQLYFSTMDSENSTAVLDMLVNEIDNCSDEAPSRIVKSLGGILYTVKAQRFSVDENPYTTFYISRNKAPLSSSRCGISYYTCQEALQSFYDAFYSITGTVATLEKDIGRLNLSQQPIMLLGEEGVGKEQVATILYTRGPIHHHPMVSINCALLNDKTWEFLQSSHNSPFAQSENTLFISHLSDLSLEQRRFLLATLTGMEVCRRNRVIFSCVCTNDVQLSEAASEFIDTLCCLKLYLPPLREQVKHIPTMISLYLNQLNVSQAHEVLGMDPDAVQLMQTFPWPHNYSQMKRVLWELATLTPTPIISRETVQRVLKLENTSPVVHIQGELRAPGRFDLNRSLEEMNREIIQLVLEECGGNQTAAAKRLGISRTTLWRFLNS